MASNWSELSEGLLTLLTDKLIFIKDYVQFGANCLNWHSAFSKNVDRLPPQLPLLMIPAERTRDKQTYSFYSVHDRRFDDFQVAVQRFYSFELAMPSFYSFRFAMPRFYDFQVVMPRNRSCHGSSIGWLLTVEENSLEEVRLINPFSSINNEICLPSLNSLDTGEQGTVLTCFQIHKFVLSANPASTPNYVVVIIYGEYSRLGFFKAGDKSWTSIDFQWVAFTDVIYYKGQFYAIHGDLVACDFSSPRPKFTKIALSWPVLSIEKPIQIYLVEVSGNLLMIIKNLYSRNDDSDNLSLNIGFQALKMDLIEQCWVEVTNIGNFSLFLGGNSSLSILASDFSGCERNRMYFTEEISESVVFRSPLWYIEMGVFNIEDGSIESHPSLMEYARMKPPPIWVERVLHG